MGFGLAMLLAASAPVPPPAGTFDLATVGRQPGTAGMIDNERDAIGFLPHRCSGTSPTEIVVCARRGPSTSPRLPLPAERYEPGEAVRFKEPGSPGSADVNTANCSRPGTCEPSRLGETIGNVIHWLSGG